MTERVLEILRGVALASSAALVAVASVGIVVSRNDTIFQLEATIADDALRLARGGVLFARADAPPFAVVPYGPLFYGPIAAGTRALGSSPDSAYFAERGFAVLAWLVSAAATLSIARSLGASARGALLAVPAALSFGVAWPAVGPTLFAAALELVGLATWLRKRRFAALVAFVAAAAIKANAVGLIGGVLLAEMLLGRIRLALLSALAFASAVATVHGVTAWVTEGAWWRALHLATVTDTKSAWTAYGATLGVLSRGLPTVLLVAALVRRDSASLRVLGALLCAFALAVFGVSKAGAGAYYFTDVAFLTGAAAAVGIEELQQRAPTLAGGALLALLVALLPTRALLSQWKQELLAASRLGDELTALARLPPGPVLSETPEVAVRSGREVWGSDPYTLSLAVHSGRADVGALVSELERCAVAGVVLSRRPYPERPAYLLRGTGGADERFRDALTAHYSRVATTAEHVILAPKDGCGAPGRRMPTSPVR